MAEPLTIGAITAAVGAVIGYGRMQQKVNRNTEDITKLATNEKLDFVHTALDGRLERIEDKLDTIGKMKPEWLNG